MAIFIPAGGSFMARGGPIFWNAPIRRAHSPGGIPLVGDVSIPLGADTFLTIGTSATSMTADYVRISFDHGGRIDIPVILYISTFTGANETYNLQLQCFVNSVLTVTSPVYSFTGTILNTSRRWSFTVQLLNLSVNSRIVLRIVYSRTGIAATFRVGLRVERIFSSIFGGWVVENLPGVSVVTGQPIAGSVAPSPIVADINERPAPPIRVVAPMMPIAQRARIVV